MPILDDPSSRHHEPIPDHGKRAHEVLHHRQIVEGFIECGDAVGYVRDRDLGRGCEQPEGPIPACGRAIHKERAARIIKGYLTVSIASLIPEGFHPNQIISVPVMHKPTRINFDFVPDDRPSGGLIIDNGQVILSLCNTCDIVSYASY